MISGNVTDGKSAVEAFFIGATGNYLSKNVSNLLLHNQAKAIFNQSNKAKSLAVQKLQGSPFNMGASALKGNMRNAFKGTTLPTISDLIKKANPLYRLDIYSSAGSSLFPVAPYMFLSNEPGVPKAGF
ncbi:MAG: hypothetical protein FWG40_10945 [Peptococcaceae bacterium]|nr:hypothetical protein [Peptococcaceae bacterium]